MDTHNLLGSAQGNGVLLGSAPALKQTTHTCTGRLLRKVKLGADMSTPMARLIHRCTVAEITADHATGHGGLTPLSSFLVLVLPEPAYRSNALRCFARAWEKQSG